MRLVVEPSARDLGIINPVTCLIENITVQPAPPALTAEIDKRLGILKQTHERILAAPETAGFAELFAKMGYPDQTPAGQRMIETTLTRGMKSYNNVIDAYNIVSVMHGCGLGLHDLSGHDGDLCAWRADGSETIVPMFKSEAKPVNAGDLVYGLVSPSASEQRTLLAWLGKRDVDSDTYKVTNESTSLLLVVLGNARTSREHNVVICHEVLELLRLSCSEARAKFVDMA